MGETKTRSIRVGDDVWEAIQALPGKTDDALRAVLVNRKVVADPHVEINRWFRETWKRLEDLPAEILEAADARKANRTIGGSVPVQKTDQVAYYGEAAPIGFKIRCYHCGRPDAMAGTKFATVCSGCKSAGHTLQPSECPVCTLAGTGGL